MIVLLLTLIPSLSCIEIVKRYDWCANPRNAAGEDLTRITDIVIGNDGKCGSLSW